MPVQVGFYQAYNIFMCPLASIQLPTYSVLAHFPLIG